VDVWLTKSVAEPVEWRRTSGCTGGVTAVNYENLGNTPLSNSFYLPPRKVTELQGKFLKHQELYKKSGGVHFSALSNGNQILLCIEDIGRHNTLDKITGRCLLDKIALEKNILLTTGRISSEMLQKAVGIGAVIIISLTSPTSLSIEMAEKAGITLIGYARGSRFIVYTHHQRIEAFNANSISVA
jgi:FdhD protein